MTKGIQIYRSNRLEVLKDALCRLLGESPLSPLESEPVLVHSNAMANWLQHCIAQELGICAQYFFPFPRNYLPELVTKTLGRSEDGPRLWHQNKLIWRVLQRLPLLLENPEFDVIKRYINMEPHSLKAIQLSERIARIFDAYLIYRPDLIAAWEKGEESHWQAVLWRALVEGAEGEHFPGLLSELTDRLQREGPLEGQIPGRLSLFGISTLSPIHLQSIELLSSMCEIHLFVLSPTREFFADTRSPKEIARALQRDATADGALLHYEEGHSLIATMGRVGGDFQRLIEEHLTYRESGLDLFIEHESSTLLNRLQQDMLMLEERGEDKSLPPTPIMEEDRDSSISVHYCHGPKRQVEALCDVLLARFEEDSSLTPSDVVVMTPQLDLFLPLIEAIFPRDVQGRGGIPFQLADLTALRTNPVAEGVLAVLALVDSRVTASQVAKLLSMSPVQQRFDIQGDDVDQVLYWIDAAGIRWGIDAAHRAELDQPGLIHNTWEFGLNRLFLGMATHETDALGVGETLPIEAVEGQSGRLLGRLAEFCEVLFRTIRQFKKPRTLQEWEHQLLQLVGEMFDVPDGDSWQVYGCRDQINGLAEDGMLSGYEGMLSVDVVAYLLEQGFTNQNAYAGFQSGAVNVCAMLPLRSIPFRVVCLLGMDEMVFPRYERRVDFDLISRSPRVGDRSPRMDDKYLFLEAILSARDHLVISYSAYNQKTGRLLSPSSCVTALLEHLDDAFYLQGGEESRSILEQVSVKHPLHPFEPSCFTGDSLSKGFNEHDLRGAQALVEGVRESTCFMEKPLDEMIGVESSISIHELISFLINPAGYWLNEQLGLRWDRAGLVLEDREPIELHSLARWEVGERLLRGQLEDVPAPLHAMSAIETARGVLPLGNLGAWAFDQLLIDAEPAAERIVELIDGGDERREAVDVEVDGTRLVGRLDHIFGRRRVEYRFGKLRPKDRLRLWVKHLVANATGWGAGLESCLVATGPPDKQKTETLTLQPVEEPLDQLEKLLELYQRGRQEPLLFYPDISYGYAEKLNKSKENWDDEASQKKARGSLKSSWEKRSVKEAWESELILGGTRPWEPGLKVGAIPGDERLSFHRLSEQIWGPLFRSAQKEGGQ